MINYMNKKKYSTAQRGKACINASGFRIFRVQHPLPSRRENWKEPADGSNIAVIELFSGKELRQKSRTITNISFVSGMNNKKPGFLAESRV